MSCKIHSQKLILSTGLTAKSVLQTVEKVRSKLTTSISNRKLCCVFTLKYWPTHDNPADHLTWGLYTASFHEQYLIWIHGPYNLVTSYIEHSLLNGQKYIITAWINERQCILVALWLFKRSSSHIQTVGMLFLKSVFLTEEYTAHFNIWFSLTIGNLL